MCRIQFSRCGQSLQNLTKFSSENPPQVNVKFDTILDKSFKIKWEVENVNKERVKNFLFKISKIKSFFCLRPKPFEFFETFTGSNSSLFGRSLGISYRMGPAEISGCEF